MVARDAHGGPVKDLAFSPDGQYIASVGGDLYETGNNDTARLWNAETGALVHVLARDEGVEFGSVAFNAEGTLIAAGTTFQPVDDGAERFMVWDVQTGTRLIVINGTMTVHFTRVAFSPDGTLLAARQSDNTLRLWGIR